MGREAGVDTEELILGPHVPKIQPKRDGMDSAFHAL